MANHKHMSEQRRTQSRRAFLGKAVASGVALRQGARNHRGSAELPRRTLGKTGEAVTILGLGCAYAGGGVDETTTRKTIETALEGGVRYFDSAPEYTQAEERLGPVIKPVRDEVFLTTKTYAQDAVQAENDLTQALANLQTGHVDLFLQHGVGLDSVSDVHKMLGKGGSFEFLRKAKEQGRARFIGMSVHAPHSVALELLRASADWDVIMPFVNYVSHAQDGDALLTMARERALGMVAMKVLGGNPGLLADNYDRAFRYALSVEGVACALIGVSNRHQVTRAVRAAREFRALTPEEMTETLEIGRKQAENQSAVVRTLDRHRQYGFRRA